MVSVLCGGKNVAVTVLRPQRYTKEFIDQSESFTLSFYDDTFKKDLSYLGSVSGRDEDKIAKTRLTPTDANGIPFFEEAKIVLICKKLYSQPMDPAGFVDKSLDEQWYPREGLSRTLRCRDRTDPCKKRFIKNIQGRTERLGSAFRTK